MILYLDTSALVKLYVEELHSDKVRELAAQAEVIATCRIAYPEAISAFTRRKNRNELNNEDYRRLLEVLQNDWESYAVADFDERAAGDLAVRHGLRGFDAVHLSSAKVIAASSNSPILLFSSFDQKLNEAARQENLPVAE